SKKVRLPRSRSRSGCASASTATSRRARKSDWRRNSSSPTCRETGWGTCARLLYWAYEGSGATSCSRPRSSHPGESRVPHEYDDPITDENVEAAARIARELSSKQPAVPIDSHVAEAVDQTFCGCSTSIQDGIEGGMSGL